MVLWRQKKAKQTREKTVPENALLFGHFFLFNNNIFLIVKYLSTFHRRIRLMTQQKSWYFFEVKKRKSSLNFKSAWKIIENNFLENSDDHAKWISSQKRDILSIMLFWCFTIPSISIQNLIPSTFISKGKIIWLNF